MKVKVKGYVSGREIVVLEKEDIDIFLYFMAINVITRYRMINTVSSRGQSSKTNWFGIKSANLFSVRMDVQFSSFFTNIRKCIEIQRKNYAHYKMCMSMYKPL